VLLAQTLLDELFAELGAQPLFIGSGRFNDGHWRHGVARWSAISWGQDKPIYIAKAAV
jgi:hypothetical protein